MLPPCRISVLLSARDAAQAVVPSITSALRALGPDDEIVAVDDGSSDDTFERMHALLNGARHQLLRTDGVGLTAALRLGSDAARGEFIARLDAGDTMTADRLDLQCRQFARTPDLVACGANVRFVNQRGRVLGSSAYPESDLGIRACLLVMASPFVHSTLCVRRSALVEVGSYRKFFRYAQDFDLVLRLSRVGRLRNARAVVGDYLVSSNGISSTRADDQYRFAVIAWKCHVASALGWERAPEAWDGDLPAWDRARMRAVRRLRGETMAARDRGQNARARMLTGAYALLSPVATMVSGTVRVAEHLSSPLQRLHERGSDAAEPMTYAGGKTEPTRDTVASESNGQLR